MASRVPKIVTMEGIIASGKSTLLSKLQRHLSHWNIKIVPEPIASWENVTAFKPPMDSLNLKEMDEFADSMDWREPTVNGDRSKRGQFELLSQMYQNPQRWCFSFQVQFDWMYFVQFP